MTRKSRPGDRQRVLEELTWHTDDPKLAFDLLAPGEINEILKYGFMPRELAIDLRNRIAAKRGTAVVAPADLGVE